MVFAWHPEHSDAVLFSAAMFWIDALLFGPTGGSPDYSFRMKAEYEFRYARRGARTPCTPTESATGCGRAPRRKASEALRRQWVRSKHERAACTLQPFAGRILSVIGE